MSDRGSDREDFDVTIIGSGIGGLTAGAFLARQGIRTLVCEQGDRPGGYFTSFTRGGYTFDAGIQECENAGLLIPTLEKLGAAERIERRKSRVALALPGFFRGLTHWSDLVLYYENFKKVFPHESAALDRVEREAMRFCGIMDALA